MKKIVLLVAIAVTAANLTLGVAYAAVCQDTTGNRSCGTTCKRPAAAKVVMHWRLHRRRKELGRRRKSRRRGRSL
jgi:hypothetical protein